jgi:hypothetical protein
MYRLAIISVIASFVAAIWKPIAAVLFVRQAAKAGDLKKANEVRRRAQVVKENHNETVTRIDDDVLDQRLRKLRAEK